MPVLMKFTPFKKVTSQKRIGTKARIREEMEFILARYDSGALPHCVYKVLEDLQQQLERASMNSARPVDHQPVRHPYCRHRNRLEHEKQRWKTVTSSSSGPVTTA